MSDVATYSLRLPRSLRAAIERVAKHDGTSINQFVAIAAAEKLAVLDTQDYFRSHVERADLQAFDQIMARAGGQPPTRGRPALTWEERCLRSRALTRPASGYVAGKGRLQMFSGSPPGKPVT